LSIANFRVADLTDNRATDDSAGNWFTRRGVQVVGRRLPGPVMKACILTMLSLLAASFSAVRLSDLPSLFSLTLFADHAGVVAAQPADKSAIRVSPCTATENAMASSPEVAQRFEQQSSDNRPAFQWCEAMEVSWLPSAMVLRFHSAIHVDYAYTTTLIRAAPGTRLYVTGFREGLVRRHPPNLTNTISAFNELLDSATGNLDQARIEDACLLYLFIVGREDHSGMFRRPQEKHNFGRNNYKPSCRIEAGRRVITLHARTSVWRFAFSSHGGKLGLDSISEVGG